MCSNPALTVSHGVTTSVSDTFVKSKAPPCWVAHLPVLQLQHFTHFMFGAVFVIVFAVSFTPPTLVIWDDFKRYRVIWDQSLDTE